MKKWAAAPEALDVLERCEIHPGKAVELVCVDHDQLCCHGCVAVNQRQCSSIQHIPDVAQGIREDPMFTQLPQKVADLRKQLENMQDARKKNGAALRKTRAVIVDEIRTLRKKINEILDRMEKTTVQELDDLIAKQVMSIQKDIDLCTQMDEDMKSLIDAIENEKKTLANPPCTLDVRSVKISLRRQKKLYIECQQLKRTI
ncbi:uncharacterized protein LOC128211144 [Mya arenaria]|uniref:uncharacterized protein LOC128211144 n=1 Tax=Mya arenaria TaxID=6604 RepID=UPI0022E81632|nr:uncharacterized protein LOC128211144 [Mya arenaria]